MKRLYDTENQKRKKKPGEGMPGIDAAGYGTAKA